MKETLIDLKERRSCRKYKAEQVSEEELNAVLEAATYAPTGHGQQSPVMVVVQDSALVARLSRINAQIMNTTRDPFYGAPTAVVVFEDTSNSTGHEDACMVMANLLNAAHAVGLGSCWINRGRQMFELPEGAEIKASWGLGSQMAGLAVCILGYAAEGGIVEPKPRKDGYIIRA
ncbi:MAG: nitroreductase [Akkermansia sp.]|nr:nitroreductase [Akkermansia sp.]